MMDAIGLWHSHFYETFISELPKSFPEKKVFGPTLAGGHTLIYLTDQQQL